MEVDEAFSLISHAIDTGHAAHGYLIVGDLKGCCEPLADRILKKLFPDAAAQIDSKSHPDITYLEPEGAKRIIKVESMRERIVEPMSLAAFSGGWKVGVIVGADRIEMAGEDFHARLRAGFAELAKSEPERIVTIDANGGADEVWESVWKSMRRFR